MEKLVALRTYRKGYIRWITVFYISRVAPKLGCTICGKIYFWYQNKIRRKQLTQVVFHFQVFCLNPIQHEGRYKRSLQQVGSVLLLEHKGTQTFSEPWCSHQFCDDPRRCHSMNKKKQAGRLSFPELVIQVRVTCDSWSGHIIWEICKC